ncbi:MAG: hypothetical protein R2744_09400 [Bacteroidales bacterium]
MFTVFWISGGHEQHYRVTDDKNIFLQEQQLLREGEEPAGSDQREEICERHEI